MAERGEADKCIKILKNIAKTNQKEVKKDIYDSFKVSNFGFKMYSCPRLQKVILFRNLSKNNMRQPKVFQFQN